MIPNWYSSLVPFIPLIFFIEVVIAIRIYRIIRKNKALDAKQGQPVLLVVSSNTPSRFSIIDRNSSPDRSYQITQQVFPLPHKSSTQDRWTSLRLGVCLSGVFLLIFLLINYQLRPYTYLWTLMFLPILVPIPFLVLAQLLALKPFAAFSCLLGGLGLGVFSFLVLLG